MEAEYVMCEHTSTVPLEGAVVSTDVVVNGCRAVDHRP